MTDIAVTVAGRPAIRFELHVPNVGPWYADVGFADEMPITGRQAIISGDNTLVGTVADQFVGSWVGCQTIRIIGGAAGWGKTLRQKLYHNDAGVKTRTVATEAATEAGETLDTFQPASSTLGSNYCRSATYASRVLESAAGGVPWRVEFDGKTRVAPIPTSTLSENEARVLAYEPKVKLVELGIDGFEAVALGRQISDPRFGDEVLTIREYRIEMSAGRFLATCWCGGLPTEGARLPRLLSQVVRRSQPDRILGRWRYRLKSQASDGRLDLQVVDRNSGLPDLKLTPQQMGVPGLTAELKSGVQVLVEFLDGGNPALPCVTGYASESDNSFVPTELVLGGKTGQGVARIGDTVHILLPPATCTVMVGAVPAAGTIIFPTGYTDGTIETGSSIVKAHD